VALVQGDSVTLTVDAPVVIQSVGIVEEVLALKSRVAVLAGAGFYRSVKCSPRASAVIPDYEADWAMRVLMARAPEIAHRFVPAWIIPLITDAIDELSARADDLAAAQAIAEWERAADALQAAQGSALDALGDDPGRRSPEGD
jgi:hypothetical protein